MKDYGVYKLNKKEERSFYILLLLISLSTGFLYFGNILFGLPLMLLAPKFKKMYEKYRAEKQQKELRSQFKDVLYSLSASFAAGRQMSTALSEAAENIALLYPSGSDMENELRYMVRGIFESRLSEEGLLSDFAARSRVEDIENFSEVYLTCRSTGADVERVVSRAAENLMEKMEIEKTIEVLSSQKKLEGKIISLMPAAVLLFLNLLSPDYISMLYESILGRIIMAVSLGINAVSYYMIMRMTNVKV